MRNRLARSAPSASASVAALSIAWRRGVPISRPRCPTTASRSQPRWSLRSRQRFCCTTPRTTRGSTRASLLTRQHSRRTTRNSRSTFIRARSTPSITIPVPPVTTRSEERRVGKECRSRRRPDQAEDGIRADLVTGVQTCALPISEMVPAIKAALLLHYAENDERIDKGIAAYEAALKANNKKFTIYIYPGTQHAFNNDTGAARYNKIGRASCRERV